MVKISFLIQKNIGIFVFFVLAWIIFYPVDSIAERVTAGYVWTNTVGGSTGFDGPLSIAIDSSGNIYTTGFFIGTVDFDPSGSTDNHTSNGFNDIFLTKINADGSYGYTKTMGGTGNENGYSVTTDSSGNVFIAGRYSSTVDFDPSGSTDNHTSNGGSDIFLTKFASDGSYGFTKTVGGAFNDVAYSVATDSTGNIYTTGSFLSSFDFDPSAGTDTHTDAGSGDIFLTKFNANGTYGYTKNMGSTSFDLGYSLSLDSSNNVYITGYFSGTVDFNPSVSTDNHTSAGSLDTFLTKFTSAGTYVFTKHFGGTGDDQGYSVTVDSLDNSFVTGYFSGTVDFDPSGSTDNHTSNGSYDLFLAKFASDGSYLFTKTIGGSGAEYGFSVATDSLDNAYIVSQFSGTVDFDPSGSTDNHTSNGSQDIFLTKINADGTYGYTKTMGGTGNDNGVAVSLDSTDNVYITGSFSNTVDFDPSGSTDNHTSNGGVDIFLTKFSPATYYHITSLPVSLSAETVEDSLSVDDTGVDDGILANGTANIRIKSGILPLADISTTFSSDLNWATLDGDSDASTFKAFIHNLTVVDGAGASFTLYVPYNTGDTIVNICPNATSLSGVSIDCVGAMTYADGESGVTIVTIGSTEFWSVPNQTGTGGISVVSLATATTIPLNLSATPSDAEVNLTWDTPTSDGGSTITGYKVYRDTTSTPTTLIATLGVVTTYQDTSVVNGTTYYYRVKATNAIGDSDYSTEDSAMPTAATVVEETQSHTISGSASTLTRQKILVLPIIPPTDCADGFNFSPSTGQSCKSLAVNNNIKNIINTLKFGLSIPEVKDLQKYLNTHGFPISTSGFGSIGQETNYFGQKTKTAVILFQKSKGLTPDGIVGPMTRAIINSGI